MGYCEVWQPYREEVKERYPLVMERLEQIETEETVRQPYRAYFQRAAAFLRELKELEEEVTSGAWEKKSLEEMSRKNRSLYEEILPEHYEKVMVILSMQRENWESSMENCLAYCMQISVL